MNALSKAIIAEAVVSEVGLTKSDAKTIAEEFFETIREYLADGESVRLSGYGNFILRDKPQRPGRNPKTGVEIPVIARRVVTFKPGLKLKKRIESSAQKE